MGNVLLQRAAHQRPATTKRGALERLFTLMFKGFVYNQIWEDPVVDLDALKLEPHHRLITIASGGCNVLNYLAAGPKQIIAVDLNPNHVALTKLKLQSFAHLPDHETFFRFFGHANDKANRRVFDDFLSRRLDPETRRYWERRMPLHGRRINMFARNLYRYGLLGRFIGVLHVVAKLHGKRLQDILSAQDAGRAAGDLRADDRAVVRQPPGAVPRAPAGVAITGSGFRRRSMTSWWRRPPTAIR